jgi:hypothetical protein
LRTTLLTALALAATIDTTTGTDERFGTAEEAEALVARAVTRFKSTYCERLESTVICAGIYKR